MSGNIAVLGRELAKHPHLSHAEFARLAGAMATTMAAIAAGKWDALQLQVVTAAREPSLAVIFRDCVVAYEEPSPVSGVAAFGQEIARHPGLSHQDHADLFNAMSGAATQMDIPLWDAVERGRTAQRVPAHLRPAFTACVRAYEGK